jgi:hypothetical protein
MRFRPGMTVQERRKYRDVVLERELALAYSRAAMFRLSYPCRRAMAMTGSHPEEARTQHSLCHDEEPGRPGCLCQCHDEERSGVVTGQQMGLFLLLLGRMRTYYEAGESCDCVIS